jgi:long-chain acyl-CoA synthetase
MAPEQKTLLDQFVQRIAQSGARLCYRWHDGRGWRDVTWAEHGARAVDVAGGLVQMGLARGDAVAILGDTRPEWATCDIGAMLAGGLSVGIYQTSTPAQVAHILADCGARWVFVQDHEQLAKVRAVRAEVPRLQKIVVWDDLPGDDPELVISLTELEGVGRSRRQTLAAELTARRAAARLEDPAILVYTSGTTGPPKGAILTYKNIRALVTLGAEAIPITADDLTMSFLPMAHVAERVASYYGRIARGTATAYARSLQTVIDDARAVRPTVFGSVPRLYEKVYARVMAEVDGGPPTRRRLFQYALRVGKEHARLRREGRPVPMALDLAHAAADRLVFHRIRGVFGGRVRYFVCGAAPISVEILEFFDALGMRINEVYGLTECTAICTANRPDGARLGTVGRAIPGAEVRLAADGEVLVRGDNVFAGYWNKPDATAEAVDPEGWLHTGDVGEMDADGYLRITDRKKDLIITAGGKNIAPANVENLIKADPVVSQAVVLGDRRKYLVALVALDPDEARKAARALGVEGASTAELARHPAMRRRVQEAIERANRDLARYEQVKAFEVLPAELTVAEGELTPTLKVKRKVVEERYRDLIERLYDGGESAAA